VRVRTALVVVVVAAVLAGCGGDDATTARLDLAVVTTVEFDDEAEPVPVASLGDGRVLVGERRTGAIRQVSAEGDLSEPIARVDVIAGGSDQRGLLGLAVADDGRLVVAEITDGAARLVWVGPASSRLANGGHLEVHPDGRLLIGIGDLQQPERVDDPDTPHGKLLGLDPAGPPQQTPTTLSTGWNNPFAFVVTDDGEIWVADNSPGEDPERLGRGDQDRPRTNLPGERAPAALVELQPGLLGLCGYLDGELTLVDISGSEPSLEGTASTDCRTGATALDDGRIAVSDGTRVRILADSSRR
jgi:Glucose / Sorbosone dehydrogenase